MFTCRTARLFVAILSLIAMGLSVAVVAQNQNTSSSQTGKKQTSTMQKSTKTPNTAMSMHKTTSVTSMKKVHRMRTTQCVPMRKSMHRKTTMHHRTMSGRCTCGRMHGKSMTTRKMHKTKKMMHTGKMGAGMGRGPSTCPPGYTMRSTKRYTTHKKTMTSHRMYRTKKSMGASYGRGRSTCPPGYTMRSTKRYTTHKKTMTSHRMYRTKKSMGASYGRGRSTCPPGYKMRSTKRYTTHKKTMTSHRTYRTKRSTTMGAAYGRGPSMKKIPSNCVPVRKTHKKTVTHKRTMTKKAPSKTMPPTTGQGPSVTTPSTGETTGTGPTEAAGAVCAAPISAIQARGHVENLCDEQAMAQQMISQSGSMCASGDYKIAYVLAAPQGWYATTTGNQLAWQPPATCDTVHIGAVVIDSLTGKPLPIAPTVDIIDQSGNVVQTKQLQFLWNPMVDHFGANFAVPSGNYTLRIHSSAPTFDRNDQTLGNRFTSPVDVTFRNVALAAQAPAPPTGAGPTEAAGAVCAAPISAIQARGHVDNLCEEQAIAQQMISQSGSMCASGDYKIAYILGAPKGRYATTTGNQLTWQPPATCDTVHIDAVVMDSLTGKPLPMAPTVDIIDQSGNVVQTKQLQFRWDPMADHFGADFAVPSGNYTLRIHSSAPTFGRGDQTLGNRFTSPVDVTFRNVALTAQAPAPPTGAGPGTGTMTTPSQSGTTDTTDSTGTTGAGAGMETTDTTTDQSPSK